MMHRGLFAICRVLLVKRLAAIIITVGAVMMESVEPFRAAHAVLLDVTRKNARRSITP
jgi:hypothetical protein